MADIDVVSACIFFEQTLLALRRSARRSVYAGAWEVVSGRVRKNEDLLDAIRREIAEETSLAARVHSTPVDVYSAPYGPDTMRVHVFVARATTQEVNLSDEHDAFRWATLDDFASLCPFPRLHRAARRAAHHVATNDDAVWVV